MITENVQLKIDLLQEQIDNLEKSGFFTEKEMDKLSFPLQQELNMLQALGIEVVDAVIVNQNHQEA